MATRATFSPGAASCLSVFGDDRDKTRSSKVATPQPGPLSPNQQATIHSRCWPPTDQTPRRSQVFGKGLRRRHDIRLENQRSMPRRQLFGRRGQCHVDRRPRQQICCSARRPRNFLLRAKGGKRQRYAFGARRQRHADRRRRATSQSSARTGNDLHDNGIRGAARAPTGLEGATASGHRARQWRNAAEKI